MYPRRNYLWSTITRFIKKSRIFRTPDDFDILVYHRPDTSPWLKKKKTLPKPPVPKLNDSLDKYLQYARVVAKGEESMKICESFTEKYRNDLGPKAQQRLLEIAENEPNWINTFWLPEMYLRNRVCLPIYSNPAYIFPKREFQTEHCQARYAAALVRGILDFKHRIDINQLEPDKLPRVDTSLSMQQYDAIFRTYRSPKQFEDVHETINESPNQHILVMCKNQTFIVDTKIDGGHASVNSLAQQFKYVQDMAKGRLGQAFPIGLITQGDRDVCAQIVQHLIKDPENEKSLNLVKSACLTVCLDEGHVNEGDPKVNQAIHLLTGFPSGDYCNRWHDKTLQVIVSRKGFNGLCIEHSVAEGIVLIRMAESALNYVEKWIGSKQHIYAQAAILPHKKPKLLSWVIPEEVRALVSDIQSDMIKLLPSLDMEVLTYNRFGKGFFKSMKVSPDATIQLCLQLAHYKLHGKLVSTYESASVRKFRHGRVDNIRAAHPEALQWVKLMFDENANEEEKYMAFKKALNKQTQVMKENITGYGLDNHMAALWLISKEQNGTLPEMFQDAVSHEVFRFPMSTSSVPTSINGTFLCYGPVVNDGYGCAYNPQEGNITFVVSSLALCQHTNSLKFKNMIEQALDIMHDFLTISQEFDKNCK